MANKIRFGFDVDDGGAVRKLRGVSDAFDKIGGPGSGASLFGNVGAKAVAAGFTLIDRAASAVIGVLGDAVSAAIEEEASIVKLDQALLANIRGWDGNREAIEGVLQARMALGFSDDEQRQSLALLVVATNDTTTALDIQRTAMDLARLKGISLMDASNALIKVEGGQYRLLKSLGITLADNATQTDALRAVQVAATGQAEKYATTTGGKLLVAQTKIGEAMETLGTEILPVVAGALSMVSAAVLWLIAKIKSLIAFVKDMIARLSAGIKKIQDFIGALGNINAGKDVGWDPISDLISGKAEGGWTGLQGPELVMTGEKGPEYIVPNHQLGSMGGGLRIEGVSERELIDIVDRGLFVRLRRAAPTAGRI